MRINYKDYPHVGNIISKRARVHRLPFKLTGHRAFTIGRHIFTVSPYDAVLIAHELVHVEQYLLMGMPKFLLKYYGEYLKYRFGGYSGSDAYHKISMEQEARDGASLWITRTTLG